MSDDIQSMEAGKLLSDVGDTPRITTTMETPPAAAPAPGARVDALGVVFDTTLHEQDRDGNPKVRADGGWMRKRGNGARKLKGEPPAGSVSFLVTPKTKPTAPPAGAPVPPPSQGPGPAPGVDQVVHEPTIEGMTTLTEADYEGTAIGLQNGLFSIARLQFGPAWQEDNDERDSWRGCLRRLWFHYQLPRFGPALELVMLACVTIAKRREDARTKQGWAKLKIWIGFKPDEPGEDKQVA